MEIILLLVFVVSVGGQVEIDVRIIGGQDASVGEFPYQVSLRYDGHHYCGGSIIDETTILTAAHCVQKKNASLLTVAVGNNYLSSGEIHKVDRYIKHEHFDSALITNDIALLKLKDPLEFNDRIRPVVLGTQYIPAGVRSVASGWGFTVVPQFSEYLQKVNLRTTDLQECYNLNANKTIVPVRSTNICTFTAMGEGTCVGDSGGPLVAHRHQIGIVSWGFGCAGSIPEVFTRVSSYIDWIEKHRY